MVHKELQQFAVLDLSLLLIQQTVKFLKANLSIQVEAIDKNFLYFHEIQTCTAYKVDDGLFSAYIVLNDTHQLSHQFTM